MCVVLHQQSAHHMRLVLQPILLHLQTLHHHQHYQVIQEATLHLITIVTKDYQHLLITLELSTTLTTIISWLHQPTNKEELTPRWHQSSPEHQSVVFLLMFKNLLFLLTEWDQRTMWMYISDITDIAILFQVVMASQLYTTFLVRFSR